MKNVLDELYGFVYTKGLQRKPRDKGRGGAPGRRRRPMHKRVLTIDLKEMCIFSAGLIFETVLLDVRNKMKNVLDVRSNSMAVLCKISTQSGDIQKNLL